MRQSVVFFLAMLVGATLTTFPVMAMAEAVTHDGGIFEVLVTTSGKADKGSAVVSVTGKAGYHCNTMYPWKLTVRSAAGEKVVKKEQAKAFSEAKVLFALDEVYVGATKAELKLSVCNDKQCETKKVDLSF